MIKVIALPNIQNTPTTQAKEIMKSGKLFGGAACLIFTQRLCYKSCFYFDGTIVCYENQIEIRGCYSLSSWIFFIKNPVTDFLLKKNLFEN